MGDTSYRGSRRQEHGARGHILELLFDSPAQFRQLAQLAGTSLLRVRARTLVARACTRATRDGTV